MIVIEDYDHMTSWCLTPSVQEAQIGPLETKTKKKKKEEKRTYLSYICSYLANRVKSDPIQNQLNILQVHCLNKLITLMLLKI